MISDDMLLHINRAATAMQDGNCARALLALADAGAVLRQLRAMEVAHNERVAEAQDAETAMMARPSNVVRFTPRLRPAPQPWGGAA